jgi:hypothetical protein
MLTITVDTNILVDVEAYEPRTSPIQRLPNVAGDTTVKLQRSASMAEERRPSGGYLNDFAAFLRRAVAVGFSEDSLVYPLGC